MIHRRLLESERAILSVKEHKEILKYLREREGEKLETALINHIESVKKYIINLLMREKKFQV